MDNLKSIPTDQEIRSALIRNAVKNLWWKIIIYMFIGYYLYSNDNDVVICVIITLLLSGNALQSHIQDAILDSLSVNFELTRDLSDCIIKFLDGQKKHG